MAPVYFRDDSPYMAGIVMVFSALLQGYDLFISSDNFVDFLSGHFECSGIALKKDLSVIPPLDIKIMLPSGSYYLLFGNLPFIQVEVSMAFSRHGFVWCCLASLLAIWLECLLYNCGACLHSCGGTLHGCGGALHCCGTRFHCYEGLPSRLRGVSSLLRVYRPLLRVYRSLLEGKLSTVVGRTFI